MCRIQRAPHAPGVGTSGARSCDGVLALHKRRLARLGRNGRRHGDRHYHGMCHRRRSDGRCRGGGNGCRGGMCHGRGGRRRHVFHGRACRLHRAGGILHHRVGPTRSLTRLGQVGDLDNLGGDLVGQLGQQGVVHPGAKLAALPAGVGPRLRDVARRRGVL